MKIALCTSEAVPFAKTGGLADVCGALPLALEDLNTEVILIMPKYRSIRLSGAVIKTQDQDFDWARMGDSVKVYFLKHDMYLREGLYGDRFGDYPDNLRRFSYFCSKTLGLFKQINFIPDVIHCHDWQTSLIPALLKAYGFSYWQGDGPNPKTLLTIHNISYQGIFPKEQMPQTGLSWEYFSLSALEFYSKVNLLKGGIQFADLVNTVSPTYSQEVKTRDFGCGLEGVLEDKGERFCGILNGVDYKAWNPAGDPHLFKNYSSNNLEDKKINKIKLQEVCGLFKNEKLPLLGFVGRLVEQKGIDLLIKVIPQLCRQGMQLIVLGLGETKYEAALFKLAKQHPTFVFFSSSFDDDLAHRIYAASDIFLMSSKFEPCGIGQLISFKYGTIPVVYKTGGLADTVIDYHLDSHKGNGFVFANYSEREFLLVIHRALKLFTDQKKWNELKRYVMGLNFSWKESAKKYIELYEKAKSL